MSQPITPKGEEVKGGEPASQGASREVAMEPYPASRSMSFAEAVSGIGNLYQEFKDARKGVPSRATVTLTGEEVQSLRQGYYAIRAVQKAVNCHDDLVSALKHIAALHIKAECLGHDIASGKDRKLLHDTEFCAGCHSLAALARAEGRA